ncbi:MAG: hypothetical protein JWO88_868 [Frankiales bacterium]|nr:hypothetical protein [Frankiales bacterium]
MSARSDHVDVPAQPTTDRERGGFWDWMFRSRATGRITLYQAPNKRLAIWFVATVALRLGHPRGWLHEVLQILAVTALAVWATDEVLRGVNPFRRLIGAAVLAVLIAGV